MYRSVLFLLIFISSYSFSQSVKIDTLEQSKGVDLTDINYPIFRTNNRKVDSLINQDIISRISHDEVIENNTATTIGKMIENGLVNLEFDITYNSNDMLSFNIEYETCGAYCYHSTQYFNYSIVSGKALTIDDVICDKERFRKIVINEKNLQFKEQKRLLKEALEKESEIDSQTYDWALEYYISCDEKFDLNTFSLNSSSVEIIHSCYLPNAIKSLAPVYELIYKYSEISEYLKIK